MHAVAAWTGGGLSLNSAHLHNGLSSWASMGPFTSTDCGHVFPTVAILVRTKDRPRFLSRTLENIAQQTFTDYNGLRD